jgi:hypothetical protein
MTQVLDLADALAKRLWGMTRAEAWVRLCCVRCKATIAAMDRKDSREWAISALCPDCYWFTTLRPVTFTFDFDHEHPDRWKGYTDDTHWNGWLNVWCTPETAKAIDAYMLKLIPDADPDDYTAGKEPVGKAGLVSLAYCYTTREADDA